MKLETVKIVSETAEGGCVVINASEYDRHIHELYVNKEDVEIEAEASVEVEVVEISEEVEEEKPEKKTTTKSSKLSRTK